MRAKLRTVSTVAAATIPMGKQVRSFRNPDTRRMEHAAYFDAWCIGYFDSAIEAWEAVNEYSTELARREAVVTADARAEYAEVMA